MKRKLAEEGKIHYESNHHVIRLNMTLPQIPSGGGFTVAPSLISDETQVSKRLRPNPPNEMYQQEQHYPQMPALSALNNCRSLPYVIALAALLVELCEPDDPDMLCKVISIANDMLKAKKGKRSFQITVNPSLQKLSHLPDRDMNRMHVYRVLLR